MLLFAFFSFLSFGLFTATFPTITVDKFNVPELGVQTQEGFWCTAVDAYHHGYQLTGNNNKKKTTIKQHHIQPKRHQDVWTDVYQGWLTSASNILVLAFPLRGDLGVWWPWLFCTLKACSTRSRMSQHASCSEKLHREITLWPGPAMIYVHGPRGPTAHQ